MPAFLECGLQMKRNGGTSRSFGEIRTEGPLNRVEFLAEGGSDGCYQAEGDARCPFHCTATLLAAVRSSSASIFSLIRPCANSDATRMAFLMALALERPWQMMLTPLT